MRPGTPGFNGERLRQARTGRGLTGITLADLLGKTRAAVSSYENGKRTPSPEVLERLSDVLNLKVEFFLRPSICHHRAIVFERSMASATKSVRLRARVRQQWLAEIVEFLSTYVELPRPNLPAMGVGVQWKSLRGSDIEEIATDVRRFWKLGDGPISDVTLLLENNGVVISRFEIGADNLDAFATWDERSGLPFIVLGSDKGSAVRSRYDAAHELGHLVMHREVDEKALNTRTDFKQIEVQANRFAAAFLVPAPSFASDLLIPRLDSFRTLKWKWEVSIKMMIHRAEEIGIVHEGQSKRMYISYSRRGWNKNEPLDDRLKVEEPRMLRRAFEAIIENQLLDRTQISNELPFVREDIEELACLPYGYLDDESPYVWAINTFKTVE